MKTIDAVLLPRHKEAGMTLEEDNDFVLLCLGSELIGRFNARLVSIDSIRDAADLEITKLGLVTLGNAGSGIEFIKRKDG